MRCRITTGRRTGAIPATRSTRRSIRSRRRTCSSCASRGRIEPATPAPSGRRSSAIRSSCTACSTRRRRSSRCSRSTRRPGQRRWVFDPFKGGGASSSLGVNRGLVFWESGDDQRIFFAAGQRLYAIDAKTGTPVSTFGEKGSVSLHEGSGPQRGRPLRAVEYARRDLQGPPDPRHARFGRARASRRRDTSARSTCGRARCAGSFTPSRGLASSATTRGRQTPGSGSAAPMPGAASPSIRRAGWCSCRPAARPSTSGAATVTARTCSPTACWCSTPPPANGAGTTSSCTTTCGIAICRRRQCWRR